MNAEEGDDNDDDDSSRLALRVHVDVGEEVVLDALLMDAVDELERRVVLARILSDYQLRLVFYWRETEKEREKGTGSGGGSYASNVVPGSVICAEAIANVERTSVDAEKRMIGITL